MAKKRDMYERLAQRRAEKVPLKIARHVKEFHVHLLPPQDVRGSLGSKEGKITKVVSVLYTRAKFAGLNDEFEANTVVEVEENWTAKQEIEKGFRSALFSAVDFIMGKYEAAMKAKQEAEAPPQDEEDTEAVEAVLASAQKEVKKNG